MSSNLKERVEYELSSLHELLEQGSTLIESSRNAVPDATTRWALGAMLQAFYNGIENIFKQIAGEYYCNPGKAERWHAELLLQMTKTDNNHPAVISTELYTVLRQYLGFRHVVRSVYTHELKWENMANLVYNCNNALAMVENAAQVFIERISK